jgi:hypothetical protein
LRKNTLDLLLYAKVRKHGIVAAVRRGRSTVA